MLVSSNGGESGQEGSTVIGSKVSHYRILEKLGEGGMGVVYKAIDERLQRSVALKFLSKDLTRDDAAKARFLHEAQAASALQHAAICTIHEIDEAPDGRMFICMDYYRGETLKERLQRGRLPVDEAIGVVAAVAAGLARAHEAGIVHRDVKPANILVTTDGDVKLLDFGVAKLTGRTQVTRTNTTVGTVAYMSPEQATGGEVTPSSDVFSLGIVLYELLTGAHPFAADNDMAVIYRIANSDPVAITEVRAEVSPEIASVVGRALARDPNRRFRTAGEFQDTLNARGQRQNRGVAEDDAIDSLAVLPFINESADPNVDYLSDGITDTLIDNLCQLPRLRVMARSTVFQYTGDAGTKTPNPRELGAALGVRAVLTGRLLERGDTLLIRAELVDTGDGTRLWGGRFRRPVADVLDIEDEISREISRNLLVRLNPEDKRRLAKRHTEEPEAHRAYLKGRHVWNRWKTPEGMRTALGFFERALEIDPLYSLAFAGVADSYSMLGNVKAVPPGEAYPKAKTAAQQGLAIDDTVAELHTSLAFVHRFWDWDWDAAEVGFKRAIELNPGYATAYRWYGQLLGGLGRHDESIAISTRALELDPLSLIIMGALGDMYFYARRYDEAIALYERSIEIDAEFLPGHTDLARAYELTGRYQDAIAEFETAAALAPKGPPEPSSGLAHVYAQMGEHEKAREILGQLIAMRSRRYVSPYGIASIYSCLGEVDKAFQWLETAYSEHDQTLVWVKVHPRLDPLRSDPRYEAFLRRMNLP
jgi:serine/threonine-protein kinase